MGWLSKVSIVVRDVIVTKKWLNIEPKFVSIGVHENHDKEQFNGTGTEVGLRI